MVELNPHAGTIAKIRFDAAGPGKFVLGMGDSRTEQVPWAFVGDPQNRFNFINWGVSGASTKQYRDFLINVCNSLDITEAYGVILAVGVNDIWYGDQTDEYVNFETYYTDILYILHQRGLRTACCTITPLENNGQVNAAYFTPLVNVISDKIRFLANQAQLPLIDYNAAFRLADYTAIPGITGDGVHLSYNGLREHWSFMAPTISQYFV